MEKFVITGGKPLKGSVVLGGAKNAGYKLMVASLLADTESVMLNVTSIGDVETVCDIIRFLGGKVESRGRTTYYIDPTITSFSIPSHFGQKSRASLLFAGPLLARFKKAIIPLPGGDKIGSSRDLDRHFGGLKAFGVDVVLENEMAHLSTKGLTACHYRFPKPSHTATETLIIAGVLANGTTVLENCGLEPEIDDLIHYLNTCGAKIKRTKDRTIEIQGVTSLKGSIHRVIPDRNQAVTYAIAAIISKGDVIIEDAHPKYLENFLEQLKLANGGYEHGDFGMRFFSKGPLRPTHVITKPHPAFMTDWQPLWTTLMTQANGESTLVETIYDNRFQYVEVLNQMGADITFFDPKPQNPESFYTFNLNPQRIYDKQGIKIKGPSSLHGIDVSVWDVRFGATLLLASLTTEEQTTLRNIYHIDRGYESIDAKLRFLGADIKRES